MRYEPVRRIGMILLAIAVTSAVVSRAQAADEPAAPPKASEPQDALPRQKKPVDANKPRSADGKAGPRRNLPPEQFEDEVSPLEPVHPITPDEKKRLEAMSRFMTGQIMEARNDFREAYEEYVKAVELDPNSVEIYRALIPLAFNLNKGKEGMEFAMKAIQLDPNNHELLRRLGEIMIAQRKHLEALQYFEQAVKSADLNKESEAHVALQRYLAILYHAMGQMDKAADAYQVVFDALIHPEKYHLDFQTRARLNADPKTQFAQIGDVFLKADRVELAMQAFEKAIEASMGKPGSLSFDLAQAYFKAKRYDDALKQLQTYFEAQLQSKGREPYELLEEILKQTGKVNEYLSRLETLAKADPYNSSLQYFLADRYLAADRLDDAENIYTKVLKDSADPEGYIGLAGIYRRRQKVDELLDVLGKAFKGEKGLDRLQDEVDAIGKDDKLVEALLAAGRKQSSGDAPQLNYYGSIILAKLSAHAKKIEPAIEFYRFALKARRSQGPVIFMEMGRFLYFEKQYARAADVFQEAANEAGRDAGKGDFLLWVSRSREMAGDTAAALSATQEALKLAPDHPELLFHEAWIYTHSRQWDEAVKRYEQIVERSKQNKELRQRCLFSISNVYVQKGDMAAGEKILEDVLAAEPDDPQGNNDLGYLYADQGKNLEKAEKMIRKAIDAEPNNPAYLDSMGWVLFKLEKYTEALPFLEKAASMPTGGDGTIFEHLGDCFEKLQKLDKAVEWWKKALKDAKESSQPDAKMVERIEGKIKQHDPGEKSASENGTKDQKEKK